MARPRNPDTRQQVLEKAAKRHVEIPPKETRPLSELEIKILVAIKTGTKRPSEIARILRLRHSSTVVNRFFHLMRYGYLEYDRRTLTYKALETIREIKL